MKAVNIAILMILTMTSIAFSEQVERYLQFNPAFKLGKYENGNYFLDAKFMGFNYQVNKYFSFSGDAAVGFTANRNDSPGNLNHYMNRLTVRTTYRPVGRVGVFAEANFSNLISGNSSPVTYFQTGNYQAVGVVFDFLEIRK